MTTIKSFVLCASDMEYGDFEEQRFFHSRSRNHILQIYDRLAVNLDVFGKPGGGEGYRWEHQELWFHTNSNRQYLDIKLTSEMKDDYLRFELEKVHEASLQHVHAVHYLPKNAPYSRDSDKWIALDKPSDTMPPLTRFMRIVLKLPGRGSTTKFKLTVQVRDRDGGFVGCDPLVGNEPPDDDLVG